MSKFIKATLESNRERVAINADHIIFIEDGTYGPSKLNMIGGQSFIVLEPLEQIEAQLLRDEFAMAAMSGFMSGDCSPYETANWIATYAYDQADAMLKERLK